MYAIIEVAGKQYWVEPNETVKVDRLTDPQGKEITFDALWASEGSEEGKAGSSSQKAKVVAEVVRELRDRKVLVFRKKPKKAYRKMRGHRQYLTELRIKSISLN